MPVNIFQPFPDLISNRLELRKLEPADAREIFLLRSEERVNEFINRPKAISVEDGLKFIHKINIGISQGEWIYWAIVPKNESDLVGTICLWNWDKDLNKAEIGFELFPSSQGKGYMHEALAKVIEFGFTKMKLQKIEAWVVAANERSLKLLDKNNFRRDLAAELKMDKLEADNNLIIYSLSKTSA